MITTKYDYRERSRLKCCSVFVLTNVSCKTNITKHFSKLCSDLTFWHRLSVDVLETRVAIGFEKFVKKVVLFIYSFSCL